MGIESIDQFLGKDKIAIMVNKINQEYILREQGRDTSILDNNLTKREVVDLIDSYKDKSDLAQQFLEIVPLYYDNAGLWWRWIGSNKCWILVDEVDVLNLINGSARVNIISSRERTEILNALKQESRKQKPKDPKKTWIQFRDEIIDIETGKRFAAKHNYFIKNPIPWDLGKTEDTPTIDKIFGEWVGVENIRTLYQIVAYCLLADYPIHRLFCLIGAGLNGKSCFLNLLKIFVGPVNATSTELDILLSSRFEVTKLHGKLLCLMGETNFNEMRKTSMLKKLTGGDLIGFEYKNKTPFESVNYAKIIIATNNLPTTDDKTLGFYRRWLIIDFPNQFSEKKEILEEIPEIEFNNLASKSVGILMDLLRDREFYNEGSIAERAKKYEDRSDPLQKFVDDSISEDFSHYITKADFMKKLTEWLKENKFRIMAENTVGKKLKEKGFLSGKRYFDWMHDGKGGQARTWEGVKWKN